MIEKKPPDLILLDIMMPEMDGFEVCGKIMENQQTRKIPVVFLSAKSEIGDIVKGFELGGVDYITKPFKPLEVKVRIKNHLKIQSAIRDKIESEKQKQLLQKERDVARNTLQFKQKFIASLSHEIRTPLTAIIGMLEIMQNTNLDKNQQDYFNTLKVSADNMAVIIDQILDFSRIESGNVKLNDQPTRIKELAEDKVVTQKVAKLMLSSLGHEVSIAQNGQEVLDIYEPGHFDIILMDIQMPLMDGVTATQKLKEKHAILPPIVGLSANAFEGDRTKYMDLSMDDYLTKPVKGTDFERLAGRLF